jgi:osmotically-inducible protein OsmY
MRSLFLTIYFVSLLGPISAGQKPRPPSASEQSNDPAAIKLAAQIRRALVKDKNLSVRAQNITVVVKDGAVTLRGTVNSTVEKQAVHQKVQQIAGSMPVHDLLTVKQ